MNSKNGQYKIVPKLHKQFCNLILFDQHEQEIKMAKYRLIHKKSKQNSSNFTTVLVRIFMNKSLLMLI